MVSTCWPPRSSDASGSRPRRPPITLAPRSRPGPWVRNPLPSRRRPCRDIRCAPACAASRDRTWLRDPRAGAGDRRLPSHRPLPIMSRVWRACRDVEVFRMRRTALMLAALALIGATSATIGAAQAAEQSTRLAGRSQSVLVAAERGDRRAQTILGFRYETGRGMPQDYQLAAAWYQRAAQQGYPRAQQLLGLMYDKGQGVAEDYVTAHYWLNLAAAGAGGREREYYLRLRNSLAFKMTVAQITEAQWRARHWRPMPER